MTARPIIATLLATLLLAGCATDTGLRDAERLALYQTHAGEPVSAFSYFGSLNGWTPLGDRALAVWTRPSEAWLLELSGPCQDLAFTPTIGLTSQMNRVHARFDKVIVGSGGGIRIPCHIAQIRPLDVKALRASERELREARVQQREGAEATP
ncbi:DUF6491 family protein [Luteimonas sp. M1R5S18]|uniref:DUF6491 family protein n=1 Tax=Luteimonas rhizosphaericola TaxID=3042024 RepID=A0ABT6JNF2_9GAMM|nr:DUF6491 family protein [Luteimonas rhizosphaericola]MDH5831988.1 DUF6491 family protein [Luteimonas rhizosphaericola]